MSQPHNYSWVNPDLHEESGFCSLCGHRPCNCAALHLDPTRPLANISVMNQFPAHQQPTIASWRDPNWGQSGSLGQVPSPNFTQYNASVGYHPVHPLDSRILGTEHSSMHGAYNFSTVIPYSPVQVDAQLANMGKAPTKEGSIYYGSPVEQHITQ